MGYFICATLALGYFGIFSMCVVGSEKGLKNPLDNEEKSEKITVWDDSDGKVQEQEQVINN